MFDCVRWVKHFSCYPFYSVAFFFFLAEFCCVAVAANTDGEVDGELSVTGLSRTGLIELDIQHCQFVFVMTALWWTNFDVTAWMQ